MKNAQKDKMLVRFSTPDPNTNTIVASRVLPDNSEEPIGMIYPDFGREEDSITYISVNNQGRILFPPTADFVDLENKFGGYAKELTEKAITENLRDEAETLIEREKAIKHLRKTNERNRGFNLLLNNF
jgi:hypothetical protein